ncbi:MAG: DUF2059 domain-containing protein [Pseudomonadota bacterium]
MRLYFLFLSVLLIGSFSIPVFAQEEAEEGLSNQPIEAIESSDANFEKRLELAAQMHEIWPIRTKIEKALDLISQRMDESQRLEFKSAMRRAINFTSLEKASIDAMADIYSVSELEAMINFYGSKAGRSASEKVLDYETALRPIMQQMVDQALLDVRLGQQ